MTCPELNPISPPLSYSLASFNTTDFDNPSSHIRELTRAGFKVLTLIPTFEAQTRVLTATYTIGEVHKRLRAVVAFNANRTPSINAIRAIAEAGIQAGMHIRFEPHVDADVTFQQAGESYWRARLAFDPVAAPPRYYNIVLKPLYDLIASIKNITIPGLPQCHPCFSLTLGSELEMSLIGFPAGWEATVDRLKALRDQDPVLKDRLVFGHKLNWDHFSIGRQNEWPDLVNKHNREVGSGPTNLTAQSQSSSVLRYLQKLDYLGVSFYVPLAGNLGGINIPKAKWQQTPTAQSVKEMADLMESQWQKWLRGMEWLGPSIEVSEAGIGDLDASQPYESGNPDSMDSAAGRNVIRHYVGALAHWVRENRQRFRNRSNNPCMAYMPVTFWTVAQYDWLGVRAAWRRWRVDDLAEWIAGYNRQTFFGE